MPSGIYKRTEEIRKKLSNSHKGYIMPEEQKNKISSALKGKTKSVQHKNRLSESMKGKMRSAESRLKQSQTRFKHGITTDGYKRIYIDGKRIKEHIYIMEQYLGRKLTKEEVPHHIDGNKLNNNISNLKLMIIKEHKSYHAIKNGLGKINRKVWNKGLTKETDERIKKLTGRKKNKR